jgi:hypothetical protein
MIDDWRTGKRRTVICVTDWRFLAAGFAGQWTSWGISDLVDVLKGHGFSRAGMAPHSWV